MKVDALSLRNANTQHGNSSNQENRVEVSLGCERCEELSLSVNGSGSAEIVVPFKRGRLSVNGSGDIEAARFDSVECSINGSGDICCASAEDASLSINGSGDITIKKVTRTARAVIRGSGDITIESGTIEHLSVEVAGSGNVEAEAVTARTAQVINGSAKLSSAGSSRSQKKHSRRSAITILKRG